MIAQNWVGLDFEPVGKVAFKALPAISSQTAVKVSLEAVPKALAIVVFNRRSASAPGKALRAAWET